MKNDILFMKKALLQANCAEKREEVPVGAVIVKDGKIISRGYNKREFSPDATAHAEIIAIKKACKKINSWRLNGCTIYVTLEPCPMCMGAIINSRIDKVVFGAYDYKSGACGSVMDIAANEKLNHHPAIIGGVLEKECSQTLTNFFRRLR